MSDGTDKQQRIIEVTDVYKCYRSGTLMHPALNGIFCTVRRGAFVVFAGRSGSGKSTLLNIIAGLELPDSGRVQICGQNILDRSRDERARFRLQHVGIVFQAYNLIRVLTARENVAYVCQLQGRPVDECTALAERWLDEVELHHLGYRYPDQLSGGQQQRVAIARALATSPEIILADEPTANLDSRTARNLLELMRRLNQKFGTTLVVASHDSMVMESADRIIYLEDGRVVVRGRPIGPRCGQPVYSCPRQPQPWHERILGWLKRRRAPRAVSR